MSTDSSEIKLHFLDYWRVIRVRLAMILLVFLLVLITAAVVTFLMPKQYQSVVTMQVNQEDTYLDVYGGKARMGSDPRFLATQFEILRRKEVLYPVIATLDLAKKWQMPKDQCYYRLLSMLDPREMRNTELVQVFVMSQDKVEAMNIANAVAQEYVNKRLSEQTDWITRSLSELKQAIIVQKANVEKLFAEMTRIGDEDGIVDNSDLSPEAVQPEAQTMARVEEAIITERTRVDGIRSKNQQIASLTDDQVIRQIQMFGLVDPTITAVLPQYNSVLAEEASMAQSGLGAKHPKILSLQAKKDSMAKQLQDQVTSLRKATAESLRIAEENLKVMEDRRLAERSSSRDSRTNSARYNKVKAEWIKAKILLDATEARYNKESVEITMPKNPAKIWDFAEVSNTPSRPVVWLNILIGGVVGLIFGISLAFFIEYLDTSVKTMEDIESFLQLPVIAVVPKNMGILMNETGDSPDAEAYRILRTNIEFNRKAADANSITIVSGGAGEGKSTTLSNLAYTFAKGGYSTLVVDADLRRPSIHRIFGVSNDTGLTDYLTSELDLEEVVHQSKVDGLYFMTSGRVASDAVGILNSQRMVEFIEEAKNRFDIVFFDSPPILGVSDASVLASAVDLTLIVVQHRRFPRAMLQRVKQTITNVGGTILGVILNNVDVRHDQYYEYYTSYYNYYTAPNRPGGKGKGGGKQVKAISSPTDTKTPGEY